MRIIMHIDMDAFFAAIEERERPELRGKPIVVGADPKEGQGRGVVSTASYAARQFGIKSAMPISRAWKLCPAPKCAYLPVDTVLYQIVSERIMKVVREVVEKYCHSERSSSGVKNPVKLTTGSFGSVRSPQDDIVMEQVSVDEAYVDVSFCESYENAEQLAWLIQDEIKKRERLTCSIGIGPNKLIAKIASDFKKPDGLTLVRPEKAQAFLDPLPVRALPGIGPKTEAVLRQKGLETILDLRLSLPRNDELWERVHGLDNSPVVEQYEAKSLGHETTFDQDTRDQAMLTRVLMELCAEVSAEIAREMVNFRTITVRVRFDNFETHTSALSLSTATDSATILKQTALKLAFPYFKTKRLIRLIGVRVSKLERR